MIQRSSPVQLVSHAPVENCPSHVDLFPEGYKRRTFLENALGKIRMQSLVLHRVWENSLHACVCKVTRRRTGRCNDVTSLAVYAQWWRWRRVGDPCTGVSHSFILVILLHRCKEHLISRQCQTRMRSALLLGDTTAMRHIATPTLTERVVITRRHNKFYGRHLFFCFTQPTMFTWYTYLKKTFCPSIFSTFFMKCGSRCSGAPFD